MKLDQTQNIDDLRKMARSKLPLPIFNYLDAGAEDEVTLWLNSAQFDQYEFLPRTLNDISNIDLSVELLGKKMNLPFFFSPTGMNRLFHHDYEPAVAKVAKGANIFYALSTVGTASIEQIGTIDPPSKMFQIYIFKDRQITQDFLDRCKEEHYDAICLTVDTPVPGNRERDRRTGMTMPPKFTPRSLLSLALHPTWTVRAALSKGFTLANLDPQKYDIDTSKQTVSAFIHSQFDQTLSWKDVEWLRKKWPGKFVIKGLITAEDAKLARKAGVDAIMVSNHGGRQLEGAPTPIDQIAPIVDEVGEEVEVICDGGIRRGSHIIKAMALGAHGCSIGKSYLYGLAAAGEKGVARAVEILTYELKTCMALLGVKSFKEISRKHVRRINETIK